MDRREMSVACDDRSKFRVTIIMPKKFGENTKKVAGNAKVHHP